MRDRAFAPCGGALLRIWRIPVTIAIVTVALQAADLRAALEYRRTAVIAGQVWRLLTGNLVHLGWMHLGRDLAGLLLIWALFAGNLQERDWLCVMVCSAAAVGAGLLLLSPEIGWYVGISGVLFGMFCAGALGEWHRRPIYCGALLAGMTGVIVWTYVWGALPGETRGLGGQIVSQAHLYGAAGGAVGAAVQGLLLRRIARPGGGRGPGRATRAGAGRGGAARADAGRY